MKEFLLQWHADFLDPDRVPFAIAAIILSAIIGMISGPLIGSGNANPFLWLLLDKLLGKTGERLDKPQRSKADLMLRGLFITIFTILIAAGIGKAFDYALGAFPDYARYLEVVFVSLLISSGAIWFSLLRLYFAMEKKNVDEDAYFAIARSSRTNLALTDDFGTTRAGMNYTARSFDKALVAPLLWYLIAGLPAAAIYAALAALCWRFGRDGKTSGFAAVALALEKLMGIIPAILSGILITLASLFTPTAKLHKGLAAWIGHKNRATYEQGGFALSAMAWSLNVSLGGASQDIDGNAIKTTWVGPQSASAKNDHKHLRRAIYINVMAHILFIAALLGMYLWAGVLEGHMLKFVETLKTL